MLAQQTLSGKIFSRTPKRVSRDEMNLAEFPLTVLSTRANPNLKTLEFKDSIRSREGEVINRSWIITGADKFGLPTASDDEVLLGLLKLTVDQNFCDRKIYFTRYELLKILRWTTEGRSYRRLQKALDRLSGVRIKATNAFFDNSSKTHSTVNFGIIDAYEINDGRDGSAGDPAPSFFIWSEVLFDSFQVGFIKKLDLAFYLNLKSAVSKRLYRYLDKHFWYKSSIAINLFTLAHEKLGISRNYKYLSSLRQQLDPAIEELVQMGFLSHIEIDGKGKHADIIFYSANGKPRNSDLRSKQSSLDQNALFEFARSNSKKQKGESSQENLRLVFDSSKTEENGSIEAQRMKTELRASLNSRGLRLPQIERLLNGCDSETLERMQKIVLYYDSLLASRSKLVSQSPVGFLYRAIENPQKFKLPGESGAFADRNPTTKSSIAERREVKVVEQGRVKSKSTDSQQDLRSRYLIERKQEAVKLKKTVEKSLLIKIQSEVEDALSKLQGLVSKERLLEAVELGVEEKLLSLFAFPSFEKWVKR